MTKELKELCEEMYTRGYRINMDALFQHKHDEHDDLMRVHDEWVNELANLGSPYVNPMKRKEVQNLFKRFFDAKSLRAELLAPYSIQYPIVDIYVRLRSAMKREQYANSLIAQLGDDFRAHTHLLVNKAASGRFGSEGFPILQLPKSYKDIILPDEGDELVEIDFSQLEYRVAAGLANDEKANDKFRSGIDVHTQTADALQISRAKAKTINFGISYGMSPAGLASRLCIDKSEAKLLINRYWAVNFLEWQERKRTIETARRNGFVETHYGFRRDSVNLTDDQIWSTKVQGTAADIYKMAMLRVGEYLKETGEGRILYGVHDSLVMSLHRGADINKILKAFTLSERRFVLAAETTFL